MVMDPSPPRAPRASRVARRRPGPVDPVGLGEESVWDYPRPPRIEPLARRARIVFGDEVVAETSRALRVCETASPPTVYIPPEDVRTAFLLASDRRTFCEWKGEASYFTLRVGEHVSRNAAWSYPEPRPGFEALRGWIAFYPGRVDACFVDDERVSPQPGGFYGGWITRGIKGPFKGEPGTEGW